MAGNGIAISALADLMNTSLAELNKGMAQSTQEQTDYPMFNLFFTDSGSVEEIANGTQTEMRIRLRDAAATYNVGLFQGKAYSRRDVMGVFRYDWVFKTHKSLIMDAREEFLNGGEAKILDESQGRLDAAYADILKTIEREAATRPDSSTPPDQEQMPMLGLQFLAGVRPSGTDTTGGFNGQTCMYGDGTTTTTLGGIDRSQLINQRARSWVATHDGTFGEATRNTLRRALVALDFKTVQPVPIRTLKAKRRTGRKAILCTTNFWLEYETTVNKATEQLEGDLAKFYGTNLTYRGVPFIRVEAWDSGALQSLMVVHTKGVYGKRKSGWWLKMGEATRPDGEAETVLGTPIYADAMLVCDNPRESLAHIHAQIA